MKTLFEDRIVQSAQRVRPTRAQLRLAGRLSASIRKHEKLFARDILRELNKFGEDIERVVLDVLEETQKDIGDDIRLAEQISSEIDTEKIIF